MSMPMLMEALRAERWSSMWSTIIRFISFRIVKNVKCSTQKYLNKNFEENAELKTKDASISIKKPDWISY